jgi:hypothetical protein
MTALDTTTTGTWGCFGWHNASRPQPSKCGISKSMLTTTGRLLANSDLANAIFAAATALYPLWRISQTINSWTRSAPLTSNICSTRSSSGVSFVAGPLAASRCRRVTAHPVSRFHAPHGKLNSSLLHKSLWHSYRNHWMQIGSIGYRKPVIF